MLSIVAVIAGLAVPRFAAAGDRYRADAAARRIAADIVLLRVRAKAMCASQTMTFTAGTGAGAYTIAGMTDPDRPAAAYRVDLTADPYRARITSAQFGGGGGTLTFGGYGMPAAGGSIQLTTGTTTRTVTVDASGEVSVQ